MDENGKKFMKPVIICCLCAKHGNVVKYVPIFSKEGKEKQLHEKIRRYTPFKVDERNEIQHVCCKCLLQLNNWHNFIQDCITAQSAIHQPVNPYEDDDFILTKSTTENSRSITLEKQCSILNIASLSSESNLLFAEYDIFADKANEHGKDRAANKKGYKCSAKESNMKSKRGGGYCIARWCLNSTKATGMSLFRIPKDKERALLWLTRAEREDLKDLDPQTLHTKYLCKEHFTDDMFMNSAKNKLVWNAVPTLFCKPDFAFKDPQNISLASNVVFPTQVIVISKSPQRKRQRPIKPKPLNVDEKTATELKKQPEAHSSKRLKFEENVDSDKCDETAAIEVERRGKNYENGACDVDLTEASGTEENSTCITSGNKVESLGHEPGTSGTASLKSSIKVNKYSELRLEKLQSIRGNSEFLLPSSSDIIRKDENISASSSEGKKNTSENDNFMNVESYLNCDAESLCLEHAYRETNERLYPCRYCGEMFLVKSNLILHQTTYHSDQPVGCESCGRVLYKSKSEFMEHVCDHSHTGNQ